MKNSLPMLLLFGSCFATAVAVDGATLTFPATLHLRPDTTSPVLAELPVGSSVTALLPEELRAESIAALPPGWIGVRYSGPVQGFVPNAAIAKDLFVRPGTVVRTGPDANSVMLTMIGDQDSAELVQVEGDWSRVVFSKPLIAFLNSTPPIPGRAPEIGALSGDTTTSGSPSVAMPASAPSTQATTVIPPTGPTFGTIDATPRVFQGYLMRTRRVLGVGPKLDHQLVDASGRRIALLDLSALLVTEPLDRFENRLIGVFGPVSRREGVKDLIIRVETLRLAE
jgi:hypothetical protein